MLLALDVVVHVHEVADGADIVGDVGIAVDGVLDGAACHRKVYHVHGLVVVEHGVDEAAGEGVAAAHAVEDVEGEQLALEGVAVVPHKGFQAVLAAAVGIADVAGDALQAGVALDEVLEDFVLLLIAGLQRHAVLPVALGVVVVILPQVVRLNAQQHIHIGQALGAEVAGFLPAPQGRAEVAVEADGQALLLGLLAHIDDETAAVGSQRRGNAAQVQPVEALQQLVQIDLGEIVLGDGAVLAVIDDLGGADAVAGLEVVCTQTVGGRLIRLGEDHGGAVDVVGAQPAHGALAEAVVRHDAEEGAVHAEVCQCEGDVGLAAAVAGLKVGGHAELFVVRRGQAQHDLAAGDEFRSGRLVAQNGVEMFHNGPPVALLGHLSRRLSYTILETGRLVLSRAARPHMTHIVVSIIVLSERICKEKKNTVRENLVGFLWIVTESVSAGRPVVSPQMGPETHGFAPTLRAGAPLLWTFAWETPLHLPLIGLPAGQMPVRSKLGVYSSRALLFCCI